MGPTRRGARQTGVDPAEGNKRARRTPRAYSGDEGDSDSQEDGAREGHRPGDASGHHGTAPAPGGHQTLDEEREAKRMRRLMRNRLSAHQARERRKQHQAEVTTISQQLHQRHAVLQDAVTVLTKENATLKALLRTVLPLQAGML